MFNLFQNKQLWRAAALVLLGLTVFGPWYYERAYMPPEFSCTFPNAKLEGDPYCGLPIPILLELFGFFRWGAGITRLLSGEVTLSDWNTVFGAWRPLLILPFLTTPLIIFAGERSRWAILNVIGWILAALASAAYLYAPPFKPFPMPWVPAAYIVTALAALALELVQPPLPGRGKHPLAATV